MVTSADTLKLDPAVLQKWQSNSNYDYNRDLFPVSTTDWRQRLIELLDDIFSNTFGSEFYQDHRTAIWITIAVIIFILIVFVVYRVRPDLFKRDEQLSTDYDVVGDTIYGVNFTAEIERAMNAGIYQEAVRLIYLQTLKWLADNHRIDWQIYKTPTQYTHEENTYTFRIFTNQFLRVRFGKFPADKDTCELMRQYQLEIEKGDHK